jgi:two-component system OmpR family response regulator
MALVLLVEDDLGVRDALEKFLRLHGFEVATADTADEAIAIVNRRRPDAAVVDLRLPQGSGRDVVMAIPPPTPIIIFSAVPDESLSLEHARPNTRLILKPFSLLMLVETLQTMLGAVERREARRVPLQ